MAPRSRRALLATVAGTIAGLSGCVFSEDTIGLNVINNHNVYHDIDVSIEDGEVYDGTFGLGPYKEDRDEFQRTEREIEIVSTTNEGSSERTLSTPGLVGVSITVDRLGEIKIEPTGYQ